ncbi:uncharacterized protein CBL_04269 [Carabus blaptoides fortunei]
MYSVDDLINQLDDGSDGEDNGEENIGHSVEEAAEDGNEEGNQNSGNENEDENNSPTKVIKKPRKQSNRPKLDVERLKGPRGLMCMEKLFSKLEFQGHGHEKEDLDIIMNTMQYWCHRLFPKFSFDDTLEHLEKLGAKKPLITLKKKILFDLIDEDQPVRQVDDVLNNDDEDINPINEFDILLEQEQIPALPVVQLTDDQKEMIERNRLLAAERRLARLEAQKQKESETSNSQADSISLSQELGTCNQLTEAQKEIIEKNRLLAIEKRRALLERQSDKTHHTPLSSSQDSETSTSVSGEYGTKTDDSNSIHLSQLTIASQRTVMSQNSNTIPEMDVLVPQSNINVPMSHDSEMGVAYQSVEQSQIPIMQDSIADSSSPMPSSEHSSTITNSQNSDSMFASQSTSAESSQINQSNSQNTDICKMEIATQSSEILSSSFSSSSNLVNVSPNPTQIEDLEMDVDD